MKPSLCVAVAYETHLDEALFWFSDPLWSILSVNVFLLMQELSVMAKNVCGRYNAKFLIDPFNTLLTHELNLSKIRTSKYLSLHDTFFITIVCIS